MEGWWDIEVCGGFSGMLRVVEGRGGLWRIVFVSLFTGPVPVICTLDMLREYFWNFFGP